MDDDDVHTDYASGEYAVDDLSVSNQDLSIAAVTTGLSGQISQALSFDGVDDYLESSTAIPDGLEEISMSFWLNTTSTATGRYILNVQGAYVLFYNGGDLQPFLTVVRLGQSTLTRTSMMASGTMLYSPMTGQPQSFMWTAASLEISPKGCIPWVLGVRRNSVVIGTGWKGDTGQERWMILLYGSVS